MRIQALHHNFVMPLRSDDNVGAFDIYMPEAGAVSGHGAKTVGLGFAAEVPENHVALILPRASAGMKHGVELNNTIGVIKPHYKDEWKVAIKTKNGSAFRWEAEDLVFQFLVVPVASVNLEEVESLD